MTEAQETADRIGEMLERTKDYATWAWWRQHRWVLRALAKGDIYAFKVDELGGLLNQYARDVVNSGGSHFWATLATEPDLCELIAAGLADRLARIHSEAWR